MATKRTSSPPLLSTDDLRPSKMKSPPIGLGKVCIICLGAPDFLVGDDDACFDDAPDHSLLLLDLDRDWDSSSYIPVNPTVCFSGVKLGVRGCGVLFSILYLFGKKTTDVFSFELSLLPSVLSTSDPLILSKDMLNRAPLLNFPKKCPMACQTPDRQKMIVFSGILSVRGNEIRDFELFDGNQWTELPDIRPILRRRCSPFFHHVRVRSYSFIDNGPLLLITTEVGNFTLDIQKLPDSDWSEHKEFKLPDTQYGVSMLIRGSLHLMDWFEWVDGTDDDPDQELRYPGLPSEAENDRRYGCGITWLSPLMNHFCVVRSHVHRVTMQAHLIIDVCDFDDDEVSKVKKRMKLAVGPASFQWDPFFSPSFLCGV